MDGKLHWSISVFDGDTTNGMSRFLGNYDINTTAAKNTMEDAWCTQHRLNIILHLNTMWRMDMAPIHPSRQTSLVASCRAAAASSFSWQIQSAIQPATPVHGIVNRLGNCFAISYITTFAYVRTLVTVNVLRGSE